MLLWNILALFLLLVETLLLGDERSYWLFNIDTLFYRYLMAGSFSSYTAYLLSDSFSVGDRLGGAVFFRHLVALFLWHFLAYLSRFIPTLLSWLIPALLLAILVRAFSLCHRCALTLVDSLALGGVGSCTLFLVLDTTLLLIFVLDHLTVHILVILHWSVEAAFFLHYIAFIACDNVNL